MMDTTVKNMHSQAQNEEQNTFEQRGTQEKSNAMINNNAAEN